jgi:hypothetical protein
VSPEFRRIGIVSPEFRNSVPEFCEFWEFGPAEQDFREFTFTNAAMLHTRNNFKGTVVEQTVAEESGLEKKSPAATA